MAWQPRLSMASIMSSPRSVVDAKAVPKRDEQRHLHRAEAVVAPAGLGVVIRDAVSHQRLVIALDEAALDRLTATPVRGWSR